MWHNYTREERVCHWSDQKVGYGELHKQSLKRLREMLHGEGEGNKVGKYGLGEERALEDFERISGINFEERTLAQNAVEGVFDVDV